VEVRKMILLEAINQLKKRHVVEVVWRNPSRLRAPRRRHKVESAGQQRRYVLQEFVEDGFLGHWATLSNLEVLVGGRAA
jgi:hypothetical protein